MAYFSVIIPVYNVERYIEQCMNSVLSQTFADFEIILVDDGSFDCCPQICDRFAEIDNRVHVIHKANSGLSSARNAGIKSAGGKYLLFLDSDDYWKNDTVLQDLFELIRENSWVQVVVFAATLVYPDGRMLEDKFDFKTSKYQEGSIGELRSLIKEDLIIGSACTKVVERKFLLENNLFFKEKIKSEDIEWVFRLSCLLPKYLYYGNHFYMYRQARAGSISNQVTEEHISQYLNIISDFCDNISEMDEVREIFLNYVAYQFAIVCSYISNISSKENRMNLYSHAKEYEFLFNYCLNPKQKKISMLYKIFGFRFVVFILGIYVKLR